MLNIGRHTHSLCGEWEGSLVKQHTHFPARLRYALLCRRREHKHTQGVLIQGHRKNDDVPGPSETWPRVCKCVGTGWSHGEAVYEPGRVTICEVVFPVVGSEDV